MNLKELTLKTFNKGVMTRKGTDEIANYAQAIREMTELMNVSYAQFNAILARKSEVLELKVGGWVVIDSYTKIIKLE